jgi:hypothetical protein
MGIGALSANLRTEQKSRIQVVLPHAALPAKLTLNPELAIERFAHRNEAHVERRRFPKAG